MTAVQLTPAQVEELRSTLESVVSDLGEEIAGTDNAEYRRILRDRREVLHGVLAAITKG